MAKGVILPSLLKFSIVLGTLALSTAGDELDESSDY